MRRFDAPDKTEGVFHWQPRAGAAIVLLRYTRHFRDGGQTLPSSLGAAGRLPPRADIGPGGQSVGQAAQPPRRRGGRAGRLSQPPLATTNKCLAQNNKSRRVIRATKDRHEWASTVADMSERYPLVYRLLIDAGHDPAKAVELLLDAKRGDEWALIWIRVLRRNRKG